jgi:uridine nucleosidase
MREALLAQPPNTAWVVATGTLTTVALLFSAFPDVAAHIKGLSIMGGALGEGFTDAPLGRLKGEGEHIGNVSKWAEFNIWVRNAPLESSNPYQPPETACHGV